MISNNFFTARIFKWEDIQVMITEACSSIQRTIVIGHQEDMMMTIVMMKLVALIKKLGKRK
jgi:hypothetical protein